VRLQVGHGNTVEQGYNTDARPLQFDEQTSQAVTHSLPLSQIPLVTIDGVAYREFVLTPNQLAKQPLLSLDELRLYVGNAPNLSGYNPGTGQLAGLNPVYDLNAGDDFSVKLNARVAHGSSNDVYVYVPDAVLSAAGGSYVYLYSKFGVTDAANGGAEQWGTPTRVTVPPLSSLSGTVYLDNNTDGKYDAGDGTLSGVTITLTGTNDLGQSVSLSTVSNAQGFYSFLALRPGTYTLTENPPPNFLQGLSNPGSLGGTMNNAQVANITVPGGVSGTNYNFGEIAVIYGGS
jgi:hypothetical protein